MVSPPFSKPRKLLPATLKAAIRRAACTGGPSSTSGRVMAMARSSLSPINFEDSSTPVNCTLANKKGERRILVRQSKEALSRTDEVIR